MDAPAVKAVARVALVLFTAAVLEQGVFSQLRIGGAAGDVLLLTALAAGLVGGPDAGALVGFFAGLTLDLLTPTPMGVGALAYCLTGYAVGAVQGSAVRMSRVRPRVLAAFGSVLGVMIYVVVSLMVGRSGLWNAHLLTVLLVVAGVNVLLIGLAMRVLRWALGEVPRQWANIR
jgi:rod shape-determining protein MreD